MGSVGIRPFVFGVIAAVLAYGGQRALQGDSWFDAALLFCGAIALFVALYWRPIFRPERNLDIAAVALHPGRVWLRWVAIAFLAIAIALAVAALRTFDAYEPFSVAAWWQHVCAVSFALVAAVCLDIAAPPSRVPLRHNHRRTYLILILLGLILFLAAALRLYRLDILPFGTWYDEAEYGLQALRILDSPDFRPIFEGAINGPAHYLYLVAAAFRLLGAGTASVRAVNALFGVVTVLAGYLVGRELFDRRAGLILAFLLAVSSWSVTLSRFGMHSTSTTPMFTLLTVGFLLRGLRRGASVDYALAGLWLGLGLCFYTSFRLFVPPIAIFLGYWPLRTWWHRRRSPGRSYWLGVGFVVLLAILVVSPVVLYGHKHPDIFWGRVQDTFIFANRPETDRWPALVGNVWRHLLMFNWHGDPNGRHNLPGSPMLDNLTGPLMVLGLAYSLRRCTDPRYLLLLTWLGFALLGGILSLDFEAPQSLRANGSLTAAYLLATVALVVLLRAWDLGVGSYYPRAIWVPFSVLLLAIGLSNIYTYFVRQSGDFAVWNAYSTPETLAAKALADLGKQEDAYLTAYFHNHPTLKFLARDSPNYSRLETTDELPLTLDPTRGALLVFNSDGERLYDEVRRVYPDAEYTATFPPMDGPPVLFTARLAPEDIQSVQGLEERYFANDTWAGVPIAVERAHTLDYDWLTQVPLPFPFSVEWEGVLHADVYGPYELYLETPGHAELYIGESPVLSGTGQMSNTVTLAEGNQTLRMRAVGAPGRFAFAWRPPGRERTVVPPTALYVPPIQANGLLGRYFGNGEWREPEILRRIDRSFGVYIHRPLLPRPYTVEWTGKIGIPETGLYRFGLESIDESMLWIDGQETVQAATPNQYFDAPLELEQGLHDIRIRFADRTDHTHLNVYWTPPGAPRQILPAGLLFPPQGDYAGVAIPTLASLLPPLPPTEGPALPLQALPGAVTVVATELAAPRGLAVAADGTVVVAEGDAGRVRVLAPTGEQLARFPFDGSSLADPSDVAVDYGRAYVLEADGGKLLWFELDGVEWGEVVVESPSVDRARGLFARTGDAIWIANTAGSSLVKVRSGSVTDVIPVLADKDSQPSDLAIGANGRFFVADAGGGRFVRLSQDGQRERIWLAAASNTVDSPHLAVDAAGVMYLTVPEAGRVLKLGPDGEPVGFWDLGMLTGRFVKPVGIAIGPDGRIWISDSHGGALLVLVPG